MSTGHDSLSSAVLGLVTFVLPGRGWSGAYLTQSTSPLPHPFHPSNFMYDVGVGYTPIVYDARRFDIPKLKTLSSLPNCLLQNNVNFKSIN